MRATVTNSPLLWLLVLSLTTMTHVKTTETNMLQMLDHLLTLVLFATYPLSGSLGHSASAFILLSGRGPNLQTLGLL